MELKIRRDIKPDAQAFDEIRLVTKPRYKMSEMSGDEWRISVIAKYFRNGILKHEEVVASNMESACAFMGFKYASVLDNAIGYFAGEDNFCDQEGCSNQKTVVLRKKNHYCKEGHKTDVYGTLVRMFCDEHKTRGDCGLDDADSNYEVVTE